MDLGEFETTVKVIVVGNGGVGKSSMTARYCKGTFTDSYKKTIGVDFLEKTIDTGTGESVKLMIWDTAGQEEFDALTSTYYRGAGACAIVFSSTDRASFEAVEKWKFKVEEQCGGNGSIAVALVQNKVDLIDAAVVTPAEVEALARKLNVKLYRTSVKQDLNVKDTFEYLAAQYILRGGDVSGVGAVAAVGDYSSASAPTSNENNNSSNSNSSSGAGKASSENGNQSSSNNNHYNNNGMSSTSAESKQTASSTSHHQPQVVSTTSSSSSSTTTTITASSSSSSNNSTTIASSTTSATAGIGSGPVKLVLPDAPASNLNNNGTIKLGAPKGTKKTSSFGFC